MTQVLQTINPRVIEDKLLSQKVEVQLNLYECFPTQLKELQDKNNLLKGEQQQPIFKAKTPWRFSHNYWAQKERKLPQNHLSGTKKSQLKIDRKQILEYFMKLLPIDAQFKGLVEVIIQDITNRTDKVLFLKQNTTLLKRKNP